MLVQILPGANFVRGACEDCPVLDKICKIATNQLDLLSVGDDREFV